MSTTAVGLSNIIIFFKVRFESSRSRAYAKCVCRLECCKASQLLVWKHRRETGHLHSLLSA